MPALLLLLLLVSGALSRTVTISNVLPRQDTTGAIMNAHDGSTTRFTPNGLFYYYGMGYAMCKENGQINGCSSCNNPRWNNTVGVWTSPDLSSGSWTYRGDALAVDSRPNCTYYRSHVVYNALTTKYVLWTNAVGCTPNAGPYVTATSPTPTGPFIFAGSTTPTLGTGGLGDFSLYVDSTDGAGYVVLTRLPNGAGPRNMYVFRLTSDYLTIVSNVTSGILPGPNLVEAPVMFRRNGIVFVFLAGCTCFGRYGGGVAVLFSTTSPLGPYTVFSSTLDPGCPMTKQTTCFQMGPGAVCNPITQAQQNSVIEVPTSDGGTEFVWTGDRWQDSPDGIFGHDPQTWLPLSFDSASLMPMPLQWVNNFTLNVSTQE